MGIERYKPYSLIYIGRLGWINDFSEISGIAVCLQVDFSKIRKINENNNISNLSG